MGLFDQAKNFLNQRVGTAVSNVVNNPVTKQLKNVTKNFGNYNIFSQFGNPQVQIPRVDFSEAAGNAAQRAVPLPYVKPVAQFAAAIPESIVNAPSDFQQAAAQTATDVGTGQVINPRVLASDAARLALPVATVATLGAGGAATKQIGTQVAKQGLFNTAKHGAITGAKYGAGFGAGAAFSEGRDEADPVRYGEKLAESILTGAGVGTLLGGGGAVGVHGVQKTASFLGKHNLQPGGIDFQAPIGPSPSEPLINKLMTEGKLTPDEAGLLYADPGINAAYEKLIAKQPYLKDVVNKARSDPRAFLTVIASNMDEATRKMVGDLNRADTVAAGRQLMGNKIIKAEPETGLLTKTSTPEQQMQPGFFDSQPAQPVRFLSGVSKPEQPLPGGMENPAQEAGVFNKPTQELPTKQLIERIQESRKYPKAERQQLEGTYTQKTNPETIAQAKSAVLLDPATAEQHALNPQNAVDQAMGAELFNHYMKIGNVAKANEIINATAGVNEGQMIQILSQYDKTTPFGAKRFADNAVKAFNELHPGKKIAMTESDTKAIYDMATKIQEMPEGRERNIAANKLVTKINNLIPSSIADKAITLWKAGLLTSLRTHERNLFGNAVHAGAEVIKDLPATVADKAMALRTGQRTLTPTLKGVVSGTKKGLQAGKDIVMTGYDPEQAIAKYDVHHVTWGNNPLEQGLKKYTDVVFRTLGAEDKPFWNAAFARSMYDQAGAAAINAGKKGDSAFIESLVGKPTPEMLKAATIDANVATFHNTNLGSKIAGVVKKELSKNEYTKIAGEVVAPFTGVPSSIAGQMVAYSPIGLMRGIARGGKVVVKDVPDLQRQAAQEIGRGVVGSGIIGLGVYLAGKGLISGQPKDLAESKQWELEHKTPNSILIDGQWRNIGSVGPESLLILAGAKAEEELAQGTEGSVGNYAAGLGKDFLSQTFLSGVQQPIAAINDPKRYGQSYVGNQASSVIPNIVKDTSKAFDATQRESNTTTDYLKNSIPFLRNKSLKKRDVLGNPIPQDPTGFAAYVDLFGSKKPKSSTVIDELSRLNNAGTNAAPGKLAKGQTIHGVKMTLTPQQLDVLESEVGPAATDALDKLFTTEKYKAMSDEDKQNEVRNLLTKVRKGIRETLDLSNPDVPLPKPVKPSKPRKAKKSTKPKPLFSGTKSSGLFHSSGSSGLFK